MRYISSVRILSSVLLCLICLVANTLFLQPYFAHAATPGYRRITPPPLVIHTPLFAVNNAVWSPDGRRLATASADGTFQVWSLGGQLLATHVEPGRSIYAHVVGWSKDGRSVLSYGAQDYQTTVLQRWDATTGKTLLVLSLAGGAVVSLSPDRTRIALLGNTLAIRDAVTGQLLRVIAPKPAFAANIVQWSPDGTRLAIINDYANASINRAEVWNALTGQYVSTYYEPSKQSVEQIAWSADSKSLFSLSSSFPSIVQKWSASTGKALFTYPLKSNDLFVDLSASPNGQSVALQGYGTLQVWSASTSKRFFTAGNNNAQVTENTWSPDGTKIVLIGNSYPMQVRVAATGRVLLTYSNASFINTVNWSPDGATLATVDTSGAVSAWSAVTTRHIATLPQQHQFENTVSWSPDSTQIVAEDGAGYDIGDWNAQTGENLGDYSFYHENLSRFKYSNRSSVAWSPDGQHVAEARNTGVIVWGNVPNTCQSNECAQDGGDHNSAISQVTWSPDSKFLASASLDKTVIVYDIANQKNHAVYTGHTSAVTTVAWSPDGKTVASGEANGIVAFWNPDTAKTLYYLRLHDQGITSVAWSPDGTRLALASLDGFVTVWNLVSKTVVLSYHMPLGGVVTSVAWSPNGKSIALAGTDKLVRVWDAATGQIIFVYTGHTDAVQAVAWSSNSTRIASASKDGTVQIWSPRY